VEISIDISNTGAETGSYTAALYINGNLEDSLTISIAPDSTQSVAFNVTKSEPGTYQVSLGGEEGQFTVVAPGTISLSGWAIVGIIGIAVGAIPPIVLIVWLVLASVI